MKTQKKTRIYFYFLLLSVFWCSIITAQPCGALNNFSSGITIGASQTPNTWYTDRYAPSGFSSPSSDIAGGLTLKESISTADAAVNRPASQQGTFYNTQGRKLDLIAGVQSVEVKLYIPSSWAASNKRMAGLWGTAFNAGNVVSAYPILEFTSDGLNPRFRGFESGDGTWHDMTLPAGFAYNTWVTLRISLQPSGEFTYTVGNLSYTTTTSHTDGSIKIANAILEGYNYDPSENPVTTANVGVNYDIYWDDFAQSTQTDALDHLTIKNANTSFYYCTIQSAINDATTLTGHTIEVASGNYSEQVLLNKGVRILGTGAAKPIINFTGTVTGKATLFDISVAGVTLENLKMNVDLVKLSSAIIATGSNLDNLTIKNDSINPIGSNAAASFGSYGNRNAVSINYANYRTAVGGVNNISFLNNVITGVANDGFGVARYFRSGVDVDEAGGTFSGNTIQSINQDIQVRFGSNGDINFTNNKINGGGAEVSGSNAGAGNINITGNIFDGTFGNTYSNSLRLKTNSNSKTTVVSGNTFNNHNWGISLESYNVVTIDNNTFTPLANSTTYRHITENTKEISSTSGFAQPIVGGIFTNNTFNGSGTTGGVALIFYNHDNDNPIFQPFTVGTAGNENKFNTGIGTFIKLDNTTGPTGTGTSPNIVAASGFPEYGGNTSITTMACWSTNLDIVNNKFDVGAGLQLPAAMSVTQRAALEPVLFHKPDAACTGILAYYYPVHNVTKATVYPTIQSAIDAASANDSIFVEAGIFTEQLSINKSLSFSGAGVGMCGTGGRPTNETHLVAPSSGSAQLINLAGPITANFDGFEIDSANIGNIAAPNQNLGFKNSVFDLTFKPSSNNLYFSSNTLTFECNAFKAISGTNDGSATHIFFAGSALNANNNSFTSGSAISSLNATTTSLPVWVNLTSGANSVNMQHNSFSKVDIGILLASNAGNIKIWNNEFSEAKRETLPFGSGMGAGIAIFGNLTPIGPISIRYNKFLNSEDGIRTSGSGTDFPSASLLSIAYNSFESMSDKAIRIGGSYSGSANNLSTTCNWFGSITGPTIATNAGASGIQILDGGNKVAYKNWLNYGTDADPLQLGFQLPTALTVTPGANNSQAENHYRVLSNAIGCVVSGQTLTLNGTFDFSNSIAQSEWAKGNNGLAGDGVGTATGTGDDYTITAPDSANNVTITATAVNSAILQGPGDLSNVSLETPLFLNSNKAYSSYKNWTISNLVFNDFDLSLMADNNGGPADVMNNFTVTNNVFRIPADLNTVTAPADNFQNIGIHLNQGKNQTISNNTIYMDGAGISDASGASSTTVALQSSTSGGNAYDGLKIINNSVHVTGVPNNSTPAKIVGFWENSNNQTAAIELSGNTFVNDDAGNLAVNNKQLAFRVTSFSGDATHQVVYKNNEITGFNRGISFIGDPFSQYGPNPYNAGENPVVITNNKFDKYNVAVSVKKDPSSTNSGSPAIVNNNSFTHVVAGGFAISNESTGITAATCNYYDTVLIANIIQNTGGGAVTYIPKLSNGNDGDIATGFQLDGTNTCVNPVVNVTQNTTYATIQAAVDAANANDSIFVTDGIYPESVMVNKALKITGQDSALVIIDKGDANYSVGGGNGFAITASNVTLRKMKVRNFDAGVNVTATVSNLLLDSLSLIENFDNGFYSNQAIDSLVIKKSTLSWNGNKNGIVTSGAFKRGILTQSSAAVGAKYYFLNNVTEYNGLVGIDVNLNKSLNGLVIDGNTSRYNADEQIGAFLGNSDATMRPISISNNTLALSGNSRFGMELKMPHGSGLATGTGSVVVSNNNVSVAVGHLGSTRDMAAIAVIRRKDGAATPSAIANDQPEGVVISGNTISNFINTTTASSGSAFGIVVGGIGHKILNNTISNSQISIQLQKGNENAGNDNNSSTPATGGNNEYFDRDNSSDACAEIGTNTITSSSAPRIVTGPSTTGTTPVQYVTNLSTTVKFCTIQTAIDYPTTVNGNTIDAAANTYAENVTVSKSLTVQGPNQTINPNTGTRAAEAIVVPAVNNVTNGRVFNVTANNVTIKGFTIDGDNPSITGGTALNGADINTATGIGTGLYSSIDGSSNLLVENNILQNFDNNNSSTGAIYGNGSQSVAITGNTFRNNKINNSNIWGILTESNYYASIQNNVITTANRGIQIDGFFIPAASPTPISGNTVGYYKRGITINNSFGTASQFTVSDNTIAPQTTGTNEDGGTGAVTTNRGIAVWSMYSGTSGTKLADNKITGAAFGMELWNNAAGKLTSTGDSVLNSTNLGISIPTQQVSFGSAGYGSFATITQATIIGSTNNGIQVIDNDGVSGTSAQVNLTNSFVTGGVSNIAITGSGIDPTTAINNNSLTGASAKSIDASGYTGTPAISATCNWYGASSAGFISSRILGNVTYAPALTSGVDGDLVAKGFQPTATCATPGKILYVNDGVSDGSDIYTTAAGNDANFGTPASPFRTIAYAASVAQAGDTIYVDAGTYIENDTLNKPITIYGTNKGASGQGTRIAESIIQSNGNKNAVITLAANNIKIDGLTIDGHDPSTPGLLLSSGDFTNVSYGIVTKTGSTVIKDTVSNNIIKRVSIGFRGDNLSTGNLISSNWFDAIGRYDFGYGISLRVNFYADVINNKMTRVWTGLHTNNHNGSGGPAIWTMSGNEIHSYAAGLCYWLNFNTATGLTIDHNQFYEEGAAAAGTWSSDPTTPASVVPNNFGILVTTLQDAVHAVVTNNKITGTDYGIGLTNIPTTNTLTLVATDTITGTNKAAVLLSNKLSNPVGTTPFGIGSASTINVAGAKISPTTGAGISINATGGTTTTLNVSAPTIINGGDTGMYLNTGASAITGNTINNLSFVGQTSKYIVLDSTALNNTTINATTATFDGLTGATATLAQNFAIEDKITHKIDTANLGFINLKAANDFVTLNSFVAPSTTPSVQRGIDVASTGFTVNVADGVYNGDININKSVTLLGQSIAATIRGLYAGNPNTAIVSANNVTVKDVTITRDYGATLADWEASTKTQGLDAENLTGLVLDHIIVKDNRNGLLIHSTPGFIIRNSTIRDNRTGIQLFGNLDNGQIINNFMNNNFTHAMVVNFDQGPTTGNNLLINNNDLSGNWYSQITFQNNSAPGTNVGSFTNFNANCNWYGSLFPVYNATNPTLPAYTAQTPSQFGGTDPLVNSDIRGVEAALITYKPYLQDGTDNDLTAVGFQPVPGSCNLTPTKLYVNDTYSGTDVYTTASGNDATGLGTSASPFATISRAIAGADAGDTIYVDGGTYRESVLVNKDHLDLRGVNFNIDPNTGSRITETVWQPAVTNLDSAIVHISSVATSTKLNGFTLNGDNNLLPASGFTSLGADIDAGYGVLADNNISSDTIKNNIITNIGVMGVSLSNTNGIATSNNAVFENNFSNILLNNGIGVYIGNNAYTIISKNVMTGVRIGVQTGNFYNADPGNSHIIGKNKIQSQVLGIWTNLHYNNASNFIVRLDTITNYPGASTLQSIGIRVQSIQGNVGVTVLDNNITGNKYGVALSNDPTTNTITVKGGTITGSGVGVWATNSFNTNNANAATSNFIVDSVNIQNATYAGIEVSDTSLTTNGSSVSLAVTDYTTINNTTTGLLLQGKKASASFTGSTPTPALFTGQTKYIDQITNGTNVPGTNIDATAVSFDGALGSAMSLPTLYATEEKINHKIDADSLGFVLVKANNAYVTPISFIAPVTTFGKIQRGVNAASTGFTVNVKAGTYTENTTIGKALTMLGAQAGQNANTRFGAFTGLKANPSIESVVTAPINNPTAGNPYANDLFRVVANNVVIDGFTFDGNNPALTTTPVVSDNNGLTIHARRAVTNIDTTDNYNPVSGLIVQNNIMQNVAQRGVSLANNGPVSTGNSITGNVIRNFGWDPLNGGQAVILFTNAYADVINNTIDVPTNQIGLHLQNFYTNGSMTWSGNNVTVGQDAIGIHANLFYTPTSTFNISGNTVNAAAGVTGTSDYTWGINMWGVQNGSTVNITNNTVGSSGGTFARGINLWNLPTSNMVTVSGGTVANSVVGVNLDNVDPYYGAGSTTLAKVTGTIITASQSGVRARAAALATAPLFAANTVGGSVSLTLDNATIDVTGTTKAVEVNAPAASGSNMASVYLTNGTKINNNTTSDIPVLISGNQAQLYAATSNIKIGTGLHDAIQFANITSGNTVSNLILAGGTTINRNGNTTAKAFSSPQYSIVEMDGTGWTAPDSTAGGNQSVLIDGAMKFTSGVLTAGNSTIEFGNEASDIMTGSSPENNTSYILGNAKMLARPVNNAALDMLGLRLAAETATNANVGNLTVLRTTLASGSINPAFPGNNSIRTVWNITPSNTTSSRGDVEFRYLSNAANLNGQTPSSIYSYRYNGGQWNKVSASLNSTLTGNIYTTASFGVPGFSPWTLSSKSSLDAPDLLPFITINDPSFTSTTNTQPITISVYNSGPVASTAAPIVLTVLKPSRQNSTLTLTNDATGTGAWTIVDHVSFYTITSIGSPVINANFGFVTITANLNTLPNISSGTYNVSVTLSNNSGGETNNTNNTTSAAINVNN